MIRKIRVAGTFVAEPVCEVLEFWSTKLRRDIAVECAPTDKVIEELLCDRFDNLETTAVAALIRLSDWIRGYSNVESRLEFMADHLIRAISNALKRAKNPILVAFCEETELLGAAGERVLKCREHLYRRLSSLSGVMLISSEDVTGTYDVQKSLDPYMEREAGVPFTFEYVAGLGTLIFRKMLAADGPPIKVVVVDCDGVLWDGVCGEDGVRNVRIDDNRRYLQRFLLELRNQGVVLCLSSKNQAADVESVFELHRADMPLTLGDFTLTEINWSAKSQSIKHFAYCLNLGMESFLFLDNSPVECEEVRAHCKDVLSLCLPSSHNTIPGFVKHIWALDRCKTTNEDRNRISRYTRHFAREKIREESLDLSDFIKRIGVSTSISDLSECEITRASQLTYRVTQFNASGLRLTEGEISRLMTDSVVLSVYLSDQFGDYGLVGLMVGSIGTRTLEVTQFLLSCRALGRGAESAMLRRLGDVALEHGLQEVVIHFRESSRNAVVRNFLRSTASNDQQGADEVRFCYEPKCAAGLQFTSVSGRLIEQAQPDQTPSCVNTNQLSANQIAEIANHFRTASDIVYAIRSRGRKKSKVADERLSVEGRVAAIWGELLGTQSIGMMDDFFNLGGDSLKAMRFIAYVRDIFGVELPLALLFADRVTVEGIARTIRQALCQR